MLAIVAIVDVVIDDIVVIVDVVVMVVFVIVDVLVDVVVVVVDVVVVDVVIVVVVVVVVVVVSDISALICIDVFFRGDTIDGRSSKLIRRAPYFDSMSGNRISVKAQGSILPISLGFTNYNVYRYFRKMRHEKKIKTCMNKTECTSNLSLIKVVTWQMSVLVGLKD